MKVFTILILIFCAYVITISAQTNVGFSTIGSTSYPQITVGNISINGEAANTGGYITANYFTTTVPLTAISIQTHGTSSGNIKVTIYNDNGGSPGTKYFNEIEVTTSASGWTTIPITTNTYLPAGTYWIAYNMNGGSGLNYITKESNVTGYIRKSIQQSYSTAFPNSATWSNLNTGFEDYVAFVGVPIEGYVKSTKTTLSASGSVTSMSFYSHATGNFRLAIYNDNSLKPGTKLWESGSTAATINTWTTVNISTGAPTTLSLTSGTYWLAWQWDSPNSGPSYTVGSSGDGYYIIQAYGAFPSTWSGGTSSSEKWSEYMTVVNQYVWSGTSTDWQVAGNWTPSRSTPLTGDFLVFSNGGTVSVTNVPTQTVGSLTLSNGSTVTLAPGSTSNVLTVNSGLTTTATDVLNLGIILGGSLTTISNSGEIQTSVLTTTSATPIPAGKTWSGSVKYNGSGAQTVVGGTYNNLTLSGSGAKTTTGATVNGILSMEGTATTTGTAPTYGSGATLQYKGTGAQTTGTEFPATWNGSGGVIIANTSGNAVTLGSAGIVNAPFTINTGAILNTSSTSNYALTFGGNFSNSGTFTANNSAINISGAANQSIAGFTTTGLVSLKNTNNSIATLLGNINGGALLINGTTGTLNLGNGLTHTFSGDISLQTGTLNGGTNTTLNVNSPTTTAWNGTGTVFTPGTGTVVFGASGNQTLSATATTFNNLTITGSGTKTLGSATTIGGTLALTNGILNAASNTLTFINGNTPITRGSGTLSSTGSLVFGTTGNIAGNAFTIPDGTFTTAPTISGLTVDRTNTLKLGNQIVTVNGTVTLTVGTLDANSNLILGGSGTIAYNGGSIINYNFPVPVASSLSPSSANAGGAQFTLTVNGSSFNPNSVIQWNGVGLTPTTFVSTTQLTAQVPAANIAAAGTATVTVFNPAPGGGTSSGLTFTINNRAAATYTSTGSGGNWNASGTWTGGLAGTYPLANDYVIIASGTTVTVTIAAACSTLTYLSTASANSIVNINSGITLTVSGVVTIPRPSSSTNNMAVGAGILNAGSIAFTNGGSSVRHEVTITTGTVTVSGDITTDNTGASASIIFTGAGTLNAGVGIMTTSTSGGTLTTYAGCTINFNGAAQTIKPGTYLGNLTLSGSGAKTVSGVTVNGIFSMEGTATASVAPTYGGAATLQYNRGTNSVPAGLEWITPFVATGGVIIKTGTTTLNAAKVLNVPLNINGSATLAMANYLLTLNSNLVNSGGTTSGTGGVTITGTAAQSIGSFTNSGTILISKTSSSTATFTGNVSGGSLNINGTLGTLNLGTGLTHTFSGDINLQNGTLNGGTNTTLFVNSPTTTAWSGNGSLFTAGTSTVNFGASSPQTITTPTTFNNLTINNSSGVNLSGNATVNGTLAFTSGRITTGTNSVILGNAATITGAGAGNYVNGKLVWNILEGAPTKTFTIGDAANYAPATVAFTGVTVAGTLTGSVTGADHSQIATSGISPTKSVNHAWTLTNTGITFTSSALTLNWVGIPTDADAGSNPANYIVGKLDGSTWSRPTTSNPTSNSIQVNGITLFSDFQVGEPSIPPSISISGGPLSFEMTAQGSSSNVQSYSVSGANLLSNITVHSPSTSFLISTTNPPTTSSDVTLTQTGGTVSPTNIYVIFKPTSVGLNSGNITIASSGIITQNVSVSGMAIAAEPTTQSSGITFTNVTINSFTINWANSGNGSNHLVVVKSGGVVDANPNDGISYNANTVFGSGAQVGTGNFVVYNGTSNTISMTGLSASTQYYVSIFEFNGSSGTENYFTTNPPTGNKSTLASEPTTQCAITFGTAASNSIVVNFSGGNGANTIIVAKPGSAVDWVPIDGSIISGVNSIFSAATDQGNGNKVIYDGPTSGATVTATDLTISTNYYFASFEYNGTGDNQNYLVNSPGTGNISTLSPSITITGGPLNLGGAIVGSTTATKSYSISGTNLAGNIIVHAPPLFLISTNDPPTTSNDITLIQSGGIINSTNIYVRFAPTSIDGFHSDIITNSTPGLTAQNVNVYGASIYPNEPSVPSSINIGTVTANSMVVTFTSGSGTGDYRTLVCRKDSSVSFVPQDGTTMNGVNNDFSLATDQGSGNKVLGDGQNLQTVTITGLAGGSTYYFAVYDYNRIFSVNNTQNYLSTPGTKSQTTGLATYTWSGGSSGDWTVAGNWSPARSAPSNTDIIVYSTGGTVTTLNIPTITIGQLSILNSTAVNLQANSANTITISGGTGTDLSVAGGSQLNINGTNALSISLAAGATGSIAGNMMFTGASHSIITATAGGLTFQSGSTLTQDAGCTGNIFGASGINGGVVFASGSTFIQKDGSDPFVLSTPLALVTFQTGSTFSIQQNASSSLYGRTYANLEINSSTFNQTDLGAGSTNEFIVDNLTIASCIQAVFTLTNVTIKGNLNVISGLASFAAPTSGTINFNGTTLQTITGPSNITFGSNEAVTINNAAGIQVSSPITISGSLSLSGGSLFLTSNNLRISSGATITASAQNFIVTNGTGYLIQNVSNIPGQKTTFPVGTSNSYNPVILDNTGTGASAQDFSVRVTTTLIPQVITTTTTLNKGWVIKSASSAGVALKATFQWTAGNNDEGTGINTGNRGSMVIGVQGGGIVPSTTAGAFDILSPVAIVNPIGPTYTICNNDFLYNDPENFDLSNARLFIVGLTAGLPVELTTFTSHITGRNIQLAWETKTEKNSDKFQILRSTLGGSWAGIGCIKAADLSNSPKDYVYTEKNMQTGKYQYRLKMIDNDGTYEYSKIIEAEITVPKNFELSQNYPNPFNPSTRINYSLPFDAKVTLVVYNITGAKIGTIINEEKAAGYYSADFNSSIVHLNLSSGIYIYRLSATDKISGKDFVSIKKMTLLK